MICRKFGGNVTLPLQSVNFEKTFPKYKNVDGETVLLVHPGPRYQDENIVISNVRMVRGPESSRQTLLSCGLRNHEPRGSLRSSRCGECPGCARQDPPSDRCPFGIKARYRRVVHPEKKLGWGRSGPRKPDDLPQGQPGGEKQCSGKPVEREESGLQDSRFCGRMETRTRSGRKRSGP